jgi:hypothetical protein
MIPTPRRSVGRVVRVLLALVVVVPLLLGAHVHGAHGAGTNPCATCVLAHHTPASPTITVALHAPLVSAPAPAVEIVARATQSATSIRSGRAPPALDAPRFV